MTSLKIGEKNYMSNGKNVLVPVSLVNKIIELLGCLDTSKYDRAIREDYDDILLALNVKMQKLEIRDAYSKIIAADSEDRRHDARMDYLWQKGRLNDLMTDGCIF